MSRPNLSSRFGVKVMSGLVTPSPLIDLNAGEPWAKKWELGQTPRNSQVSYLMLEEVWGRFAEDLGR